MKLIISVFLFFIPIVALGDVRIYKNEHSTLALETGADSSMSLTLYGGSNDSGSASPADCTIKLSTRMESGEIKASLIPFTTDLMGYNDTAKDVAVIEKDAKSIYLYFAESLDVCPLGSEFSGSYAEIDNEEHDYRNHFNTALEMNYYDALRKAKNGNNETAIKDLAPYMNQAWNNQIYNAALYNDYGYFLQKNGQLEESVKFFNKVIEKNPARIAVYLNIADSYWMMGERYKAKSSYGYYNELMIKAGKSKLIPVRVSERMKE